MSAPGEESPKRSRVLSFTGSSSNKSEKTRKSSGSHHKKSLSETHQEKEANRPRTHADPTRAIQELQPSAVALQKSNLESLRAMQHKDIYGNPITDPDLSNPTRHRFERPLDTIRSFEAAIDGSYMNRRVSYSRPDESTNGGYSRRSSYYGDRGGGAAGGPSNHRNGGYNEQANYSAHRPGLSRPDSYAESYGGGNYNTYNNGYNNNGTFPPRAPRHGGRMNSDPHMQGYNNHHHQHHPPHPQQQHQQPPPQYPPSASGSSTDVLATYADPNSINSQRQAEQTPTEAYGFNGFGGAPDLDYAQSPGGHDNGYYQDPSHNNYSSSQGYAPLANDAGGGGVGLANKPAVARKPVATFSSSPAPPPPAATAGAPEKRKSFFKRFSKS
ncbi:hypothetical protein AJ78_05517 [Emergomyces pasteurianus Ep9510]|uniref:DUF2406 domain-containing protein n=1 Tax=Emergomyces pasteurianus Ep9510 TaxID=1447872 RepID=A0A1J9QDW0_9EURO|nr:hypothetical protein AJ78_05517 [Emergomyces pasteurianus Ep9510]